MRIILFIALASLSASSFAADPGAEEMLALIRTQQQQIEQLQQQLNDTRETLQALNDQVVQNAAASDEANEKADIIADTMEDQFSSALTDTYLGGYGELHLNMLEDQTTGDDVNVIDFHRFVLFLSHDFSDRMRFNSELEVEHAYSGDGAPGKVELEQAYVEYDYAADHSFKAGIFLVPVGILNETHEPPTFYGVERNPVEKNIIPSTWWEAGLSFGGRIGDAVRYDASLSSGLYTTADTDYNIRAGRQKISKARFDSQAYTGRLSWLSLPGLEVTSTVQYQDDITQGTDPTAGSSWLFSSHVAWQYQAFGLRALYAHWTLDGPGPESVGADVQRGWYVEPSWRFNEHWGVFARYNDWDNKAGNSEDTGYTQWDVGVNYWLHPNVVFKLDYQIQDAPDGKKELDGWNLGVGYQF